MDDEFSEFITLLETGHSTEYAAKLVNFLAATPGDPDANFLLAILGNASDDQRAGLRDFIAPLSIENRTADSYERLGDAFRNAGLNKLASFAFKAAAEKDRNNPNLEPYWGNLPFNGQERRTEFFLKLLRTVNPDIIVETGTFRGSTTEFFGKNFAKGIYSCEVNDRFFGFAAARLSKYANVQLRKVDSRNFLRELADIPSLRRASVFFYLDAHWNADLPLREELTIIFKSFENPTIMIDDFEVPSQSGYGFDDYGGESILSLDILFPTVPEQASLFFPIWPSEDETGPKRGFVLIALDEISKKIDSLHEYVRGVNGLGAAIIQLKRYRQMYRHAVAGEAQLRNDIVTLRDERESEVVKLHAAVAEESRLRQELSSIIARRDNDIAARDGELLALQEELYKTRTELLNSTKLRRRILSVLSSLGLLGGASHR